MCCGHLEPVFLLVSEDGMDALHVLALLRHLLLQLGYGLLDDLLLLLELRHVVVAVAVIPALVQVHPVALSQQVLLVLEHRLQALLLR
eukprot:scaffold501620_cov48-Prasinocladus_malaysianus.AAC.3